MGFTFTRGSVAVAVLTQSGQPSDDEELLVGDDTYHFYTTPPGTSGDIEVEIGANAEGSLDNLLAAAVASGTENLYWDKLSATQLRLRSALGPQGDVAAADPDIALDASGVTNWASDVGDVNMNTLVGKTSGNQVAAATTLAITAAMITAGEARFAFTFTPSVLQVTVLLATGEKRGVGTDTYAISGNDVVVTLGGGADPDIQATDVVHIVAYE
jgi:hypothetical protein